MAVFQYEAVTQQGEVRKGHLTAFAEHDAVTRLQAMGLIPLLVKNRQEDRGEAGRNFSLGRKRLGPVHITAFTRQLAVLVGAGLSLDRALKTIATVATFPPLVVLVEDIKQAVNEGKSLSRALADHPAHFSRFYLSFVRAAELSGNMAESLNDLATYLDKSRALREKLVSALIYPAILVAVTLLSLAIIVVVVLPEFAQLFADMNAQLPTSTAFVLGLATFARQYGIVVVAVAIGLYLYFRRRQQDEQWCLERDEKLLSVALLSDLIKKVEMARLSRSLGTLLRGGVPLLTALGIAGESLQNRAIKRRLESAMASLSEGAGLAGPLMEADVFPEFALQMIQVGEETGALDDMLIKVADIYDDEVSTAIQRLLAILEPLLIIGLGVVIGGIIMSILVAILSINELPV